MMIPVIMIYMHTFMKKEYPGLAKMVEVYSMVIVKFY